MSNPQQQVRIVRDFAAPRSLVYQTWTSTQSLSRWFAPNGCKIEYRSLDFVPGGKYHSCIHTPDGYQCWCIGSYAEIIPEERIVFSMIAANAQGQAIAPAELGMDPDWPAETIVTVTFSETANGTRLILEQTVSETLAKKTGAYPSWLQMLDRLESQLESASTASLAEQPQNRKGPFHVVNSSPLQSRKDHRLDPRHSPLRNAHDECLLQISPAPLHG